MPDKTFNKVVWDGQTLIDLTSDTVTASSLQSGVTAHDRSGAQIVGTGAIGSYVSKSGDSMSGALDMLGVDINLKTSGSSSNDSADIAWWYGNGQEKARIWTDNLPTTNTGLNYRAYDSDGLELVNTKIITAITRQSLTFDTVTSAIKFKGAYSTTDMIKFKDGVDQNGSGLILGGGGLTVIGGGEAADVIASTRSGGTEELHLASDGAVALWTNVQNGESSAKKFLFNTSGDFEAPRYLKGTYVNSSASVENSYISSDSNICYSNSDGWIRKAAFSTFNSYVHPLAGNITWGGWNYAGGYGPIAAGIVNQFSSNRFAGIKGSAVTVEYTRNGGSSWTAYPDSEASRKKLFTTASSYGLGACDSTNKATANGTNYQLRITVDTGTGSVYTALNMFAINVATNGSASPTVSIYKAKNSSPASFETVVENVGLSGWSGWNIIHNFTEFTTYGNTSSQYQKIRFLFKANGGNTSYTGMQVLGIQGFGGMGWTTPSILAKNNRCYDFDENLNVTFPGQVVATYYNSSAADESGQFSVSSKMIFANTDGWFRKVSFSNFFGTLRSLVMVPRTSGTIVSSDSRVIIDEGAYYVISTGVASGYTTTAICVLTMRVHASADTSTRIYFCNQMPKPIAPVGIIPISYTTGKTANAAWYYIGTNGNGISNTGTIYKNEPHCINVAYVTALY